MQLKALASKRPSRRAPQVSEAERDAIIADGIDLKTIRSIDDLITSI